MKKYTCSVDLTIMGPFLTAASAPVGFGLDKSFHRDFQGRLAIPASHVKGKLRMSLEEINPALAPDWQLPIEKLFGSESEESLYVPSPGQLKFTDFILAATLPASDEKSDQEESGKTGKRTRTTIHKVSGTAAKHQLRTFEDRFTSGEEINFTGQVFFQAKNAAEADGIANLLRLGFTWLTNLGSEKGVGYGRLRYVLVGQPAPKRTGAKVNVSLAGTDGMHLRFKPLEPLAVGGVQKQRTNYAEAENKIPGGAIKGALAASLNRTFGVQPEYRELSKANAGEYEGYEKLAEHFSDIRVTHAFPAVAGKRRPVRMPLSTVQVEGKKFDVALSNDSTPMRRKHAPVYAIDWKVPEEYFGAAEPEKIFITHTAIENTSRRSEHGKLFVETYLSPQDKRGQAVVWICNVDFGSIKDEEERQETTRQFARAVKLCFDGLGRENRRVKVTTEKGYAKAAEGSGEMMQEGLALVTLQSEALMLEPANVRDLKPGQDLKDLYTQYWDEISGSSLQLVDFFAHQSFKGGYLYHRYLGRLERAEEPYHYRPYYLTNAGSLFKLEVKDEEKGRACLLHWRQHGLDLPAWAISEYGQYGEALWKACPFVPENGYGEIAINLDWHWTHKV